MITNVTHALSKIQDTVIIKPSLKPQMLKFKLEGKESGDVTPQLSNIHRI